MFGDILPILHLSNARAAMSFFTFPITPFRMIPGRHALQFFVAGLPPNRCSFGRLARFMNCLSAMSASYTAQGRLGCGYLETRGSGNAQINR
jgi:hypothetical protein